MAVSSTVKVPAQPSVGGTVFTAMAGDGYTSPLSMFEVNVQLTMAAGGGLATVTIDMDDRFDGLVVHTELTLFGSTVAQQYSIGLRQRGSVVTYRAFGLTNVGDLALEDQEASWDPPPLFDTEQCIAQMDNTDGDTMHFTIWVYNFRRGVLKTVPMHLLLRSIPRSGIVRP